MFPCTKNRKKGCEVGVLLTLEKHRKNWEIANGGQNVSCDFGGGGETYYRAPPPKPLLEASKWDLSGMCPFPLRRMTGREQRGGEIVIIAGGPKPFWEGFYGMFAPLLSFPPFVSL